EPRTTYRRIGPPRWPGSNRPPSRDAVAPSADASPLVRRSHRTSGSGSANLNPFATHFDGSSRTQISPPDLPKRGGRMRWPFHRPRPRGRRWPISVVRAAELVACPSEARVEVIRQLYVPPDPRFPRRRPHWEPMATPLRFIGPRPKRVSRGAGGGWWG